MKYDRVPANGPVNWAAWYLYNGHTVESRLFDRMQWQPTAECSVHSRTLVIPPQTEAPR